MPVWYVQLLGAFRVQSSDQQVARFRTRTVESLFAFLALNLGREIRRETLMEKGWPDADLPQAQQNLRTALNNLRAVLGHHTVEANRVSVRLVPEAFVVDALEFRATHELSLYQGRLLEGLPGDWILSVAQDLEDLYVQKVLEAMERTSPEAALQLGAEALRRDPSLVGVRSRMRELDHRGERAGNLAAPYILTSFVGREKELRELSILLQDNRMITLTGLGGSGKTRLASELWNRTQPESWFVSLVDVGQPEGIGDAIRQALRLPASQSRSSLEQVIANLRDVDGLLILDNYEHLLQGANLVSKLLQECPNLQVVVTSRVGLGIEGETEFPVGSLDIHPDVEGSLSESGQLFVARAQAACPSFRLDPENTPAIAELCRRLDGFPLSLELAAAKSRLFSPREMVAQLNDRFDFLRRTGSAVSRRQASLLDALDWSFDRLSEPDQELLCALSVFEGGFTLEAAVAVCRALATGSQLETLLVAAWIERAKSSGQTRFRQLESVRDYGANLLPPNRLRDLQKAHANHYTQLAIHNFQIAFSPDEPAHFDQIRDDTANLETAWTWLEKNDPEGALKLAAGLSWYWTLAGQSAQGEARVRKAMALASPEPSILLARAIHSCGTSVMFQGRFAEAEDLHRRANEMAIVVGDDLYIGLSYLQIGRAQAEIGNFATAQYYTDEGLAYVHNEENLNWISTGYTIATLLANRAGDVAKALTAGETAVDFGRRGGYLWGQASALNELAMACHFSGDYPRSIRLQEESIALKRSLQTLPSLAISFADLAATYLAMGERAQAVSALQEWASLLAQVNDFENYPRGFGTAAELFFECGKPEYAEQALSKLAELIGNRTACASEREAQTRALRARAEKGLVSNPSQKVNTSALMAALQNLELP